MKEITFKKKEIQKALPDANAMWVKHDAFYER